MKEIRSAIVCTFGLLFSTMISVLVMMNGWGVEPKSWAWILGVSFCGQVGALIIIEIGRRSDN